MMAVGKGVGAYDTLDTQEERLVARFISEQLNLNWSAHQPVLALTGRNLSAVETDIFIPSFGMIVEVCRDESEEDECIQKERLLKENGISCSIVRTYELGWKEAFLEELVAVHAIRGEILSRLEGKFPEEFRRIRKRIAVDLREFLDEAGSNI